MQVIEVYNNLMARARQLKEMRDSYLKGGPLDKAEAAALTQTIKELHEVAKNLESTEEVNPPWGTRPDKGTFSIGKQE